MRTAGIGAAAMLAGFIVAEAALYAFVAEPSDLVAGVVAVISIFLSHAVWEAARR